MWILTKTNHSVSQIKMWEMKEIFIEINLKFKIKIYLYLRRPTTPSTLHFNTLHEWNIIKDIINWKSLLKIFRELWTKLHTERNSFDQFWIALYTFQELLDITHYFLNLFKNCIKQPEVNRQLYSLIYTNLFLFYLFIFVTL